MRESVSLNKEFTGNSLMGRIDFSVLLVSSCKITISGKDVAFFPK